MFIVTFLIVITQTSIIASAISLDLFSTTTHQNNSGTSLEAPFLNVVDIPVTFSITGENGIGAGVIVSGKKYVLLEVPEEMVEKVTTDGNATVTTTISVPLTNSPMYDILDILDTLISAALSLVSTQLKETINAAFALVKSEDFGEHELTLPIENLGEGRWGVDISQGILPILTSTLIDRLENLQTVIAGIPIIGLVLAALLAPFNMAIDNLVSVLNDPNSATSLDLVSASLLGNTTANLPMLVSSPEIAEDYIANFQGGFIQTSELTIQLGTNDGAQTSIYFSAGSLTWQDGLLPDNLDFGNHQIQTVNEELWTAYENGNTNSPVTTGQIYLEDSRSIEKNWQLKVEQLSEWEHANAILAGQLRIHAGSIQTNFPLEKVTSIANQSIALQANTQQTILQLDNVSEVGNILLNIEEFQLYVPANTPKLAGKYETTMRWTLSNAP